MPDKDDSDKRPDDEREDLGNEQQPDAPDGENNQAKPGGEQQPSGKTESGEGHHEHSEAYKREHPESVKRQRKHQDKAEEHQREAEKHQQEAEKHRQDAKELRHGEPPSERTREAHETYEETRRTFDQAEQTLHGLEDTIRQAEESVKQSRKMVQGEKQPAEGGEPRPEKDGDGEAEQSELTEAAKPQKDESAPVGAGQGQKPADKSQEQDARDQNGEWKRRQQGADEAGGSVAQKPAETPGKEAEPGERRWAGGESGKPFVIVGIGASAGGIESLEKLFSEVPDNPGMAFVIIVHLMPDHVSILPELIQRHTGMKVRQIEKGMEVEKNCVYIIPPNYRVSLSGNNFRLRDVDHNLPPGTVDHFFRSLADERGENAVGVVLSGAGSDGSLGLRAIKEKLGLAIAENPDAAKFRSMPEHAIRTGLVDKVLPANQIVPFLVEVTSGRQTVSTPPAPHDLETQEWAMRRIFYILRSRTGHDFSGYKQNTVQRRIDRRINVLRLGNLSEYADYLQEHGSEAEALFKELLIGVTRFFREHEVFDLLKEKVFPEILKGKPGRSTLRIWVPGVATGEEAYSLAILLAELRDTAEYDFSAQIFATDIDDDAIEYARRGVYPGSIVEDVGRERLHRFFERVDDRFRIRREVRESVVFAVQNLIKDPPFTRMDLISCRNLLIYLNADVQRKLMPLFHYALQPHGYLVLGTSETVGEFSKLFTVADPKWRVYKVRPEGREGGLGAEVEFPVGDAAGRRLYTEQRGKRDSLLLRQTSDALLRWYAPPSVVIDQKGNVIYIHGRTGKFLEPAPGRENRSIFDMAREGLRIHLPTLVRRVTASGQKAERKRVGVRTNGDEIFVDITVRPFSRGDDSDRLLIVSFEEVTEPAPEEGEKREPEAESHEDRRQLEQELQDTRENLQTTIEELEASNEELKSMNEEYQSTNEELKSANEELETSREELQSLNEELSTLNRELRDRIDELSKSHKEVQGFLNALEVPTVFLDTELRLKRFTAHAKHLIHLIDSDIGRPLSDITYDLEDKNLIKDAQRVLDTMMYQQREVQTTDGHWYLRRIIPYRTADDRVAGVVINFIDIDEAKRKALALEEARKDLELSSVMVQAVPLGLVLLNTDLHVLKANRAFRNLVGAKSRELEGVSFYEVADGLDTPELKKALEQIAGPGNGQGPREVIVRLPKLDYMVRVRIRRVLVRDGTEDRLLLEVSQASAE